MMFPTLKSLSIATLMLPTLSELLMGLYLSIPVFLFTELLSNNVILHHVKTFSTI